MDAGRLFCFGFEGPEAPDHLLFALDRDRVGAVILFERNCVDAAQIAALTARLRDAGGEDLWILIDQEGGRVRRVRNPDIGPEAADVLGRTGEESTAKSYGDAARGLAKLGIEFNLAPVADVLTNPDNPVLRGRSFGSRPADVAGHVQAAIVATQGAGLKACAKHFPGLGAAAVDPHHAAVQCGGTVNEFREVHFVPFAAAIAAGVTAIMTTHITVPALDPARMATFSERIVGHWLESELRFAGLVLTDDLEMKGTGLAPPTAAWKAFAAGHQLMLICCDVEAQSAALRYFAQKLSGDSGARTLLVRALDRQAPYRKRFVNAGA
jgi:beta-N-acetylhexosaminidase